MTNKQKETVYELRNKGLNYSAIAKITGISIGTIKSFCSRNRINSSDAPACVNCGVALKISTQIRIKRFCSDKCRLRYWYVQNKAVAR